MPLESRSRTGHTFWRSFSIFSRRFSRLSTYLAIAQRADERVLEPWLRNIPFRRTTFLEQAGVKRRR